MALQYKVLCSSTNCMIGIERNTHLCQVAEIDISLVYLHFTDTVDSKSWTSLQNKQLFVNSLDVFALCKNKPKFQTMIKWFTFDNTRLYIKLMFYDSSRATICLSKVLFYWTQFLNLAIYAICFIFVNTFFFWLEKACFSFWLIPSFAVRFVKSSVLWSAHKILRWIFLESLQGFTGCVYKS